MTSATDPSGLQTKILDTDAQSKGGQKALTIVSQAFAMNTKQWADANGLTEPVAIKV